MDLVPDKHMWLLVAATKKSPWLLVKLKKESGDHTLDTHRWLK